MTKERKSAMLDSALRVFLRELLDDAGLFPPASLSVERALAGRVAALRSPQRWMAGRFVAPATRLEELARCDDLLREIAGLAGRALPVSIVSDRQDTRDDFVAADSYLRSGDRSMDIRSMEIRIAPTAKVGAAANVQTLLREFDKSELPRTLAVFIEIPSDAQSIVAGTIDAIADQRASGRDMLYAKLRCAGSPPDAIPSPEDIAFFLSHAHKRRVPFKLTAGLHAPLRHTDPTTGIASHGLLNVIGAAVLAFGGNLDSHLLTRILSDDRAEHFRLDDRSLSWKEYAADARMIRDARAAFVRSLGSCSFREPIEGLQRLGILPA
jgi:hypothetical protein